MVTPKLEEINFGTIVEKYIKSHFPEFYFYIIDHYPFDPDDENDIKTLKLWKEKNTKFYDNAIQVWTQTDPLKRETVEKNNLNWKEVFSDNLDTVIDVFNNYYLNK